MSDGGDVMDWTPCNSRHFVVIEPLAGSKSEDLRVSGGTDLASKF